MKILVLQGSPHKTGSSNMIAHEFIAGAKRKGHTVTVLDAAHMKLKPCVGCNRCREGSVCAQKDDNAVIREEMLHSDMVVFVTPLYYFGMSTQLKTAVDRFHGYTSELKKKEMKAALIVSLADRDDGAVAPLKAHYEKICDYLRFENAGEIFAKGCGTPLLTRSSPYLKEAYLFGLSL